MRTTRWTTLGLFLVGGLLAAQDQSRMKQMLDYLASRELLGRETGQAGCVKAATYLANQMQAMGLKTLSGTGMGGETPYHHTYTLGTAYQRPDFIQLGDLRLDAGTHFHSFGPTLPEGDTVFLGYGLEDETARVWQSVAGKWVVVLEGHPGFARAGEPFRPAASLEAKRAKAAKAGALGLMLLQGAVPESLTSEDWNRITLYRQAGPAAEGLPLVTLHGVGARMVNRHVLALDADAGFRMVEGLGRLQSGPVEPLQPSMLATTVSNLVGLLPGTDATLKSEYVVVVGHYDHIGGTTTSYYPGADDNASGTTGVMELARLLVGTSLKRSVVFLAVSGEEKGLLGSEAFCAKGPLDLSKVAAVVNLDMLGRNATRTVYITPAAVSGKVTTLVSRARELAATRAIDLSKGIDQYWQQSDHYSFAKRNIPVVFFNSGTHADLHATTDTPDKIDYEKMARIVDLAKALVIDAANATSRPAAVASTVYNAWSWPVKGQVATGLSITRQPANLTVAAGATASFSVAASGGTAPYKYQWYRGTTAISGATGASYTFTAAASDTGATFKVVVTDAASSPASVTSNPATLTVTTGSTTFAEVEPNGSTSAANVLDATITKVQAIIGSSNDQDFFKLTIPAGRTLSVSMTGPTGKDYDLYLLSSSGGSLKSSTGSTASENLSYTNSGSSMATVYLKVVGYNGAYSTTGYGLSLTR